MATNQKDTRVVRMYAADLEPGDRIVSAQGGPLVGVVDEVYEVDNQLDRVLFRIGEGANPGDKICAMSRVLHVELPRRVAS